jgi:hypothetical protein
MVRWEFALALSSAAGAVAAATHASSYIQYSTVPGYFLQDDNSTNATTFDYVSKTLSYRGTGHSCVADCGQFRSHQPDVPK